MTPTVTDDCMTVRVNQSPRRKCCEVCAFRRSDPQGLQADPDWPLLVDDWASGGHVFCCTHTVDDQGRNQVCAGYHALYGRMAAHPSIQPWREAGSDPGNRQTKATQG